MMLHVEVSGVEASLAEAIVESIREVTKLRGDVHVPRARRVAQRRQGHRRPAQARVANAATEQPSEAAHDGQGQPHSDRRRCTTRRCEASRRSGVVRTFPRSTVLINEGDVGDALYVILSGRVKVYSSNEAGREFVIDFHGPGEYVGEMTLDGAPRSASVMTVEPTTCAVVNRAQFRDFILAHPDFAMHLIDTADPPRCA